MSNIFFGRNVELETREVMTIGKIEINKKAMRIKVYEVLDEIAQVDRLIFTAVKDNDKRSEVRDKLKIVKRLVNAL